MIRTGKIVLASIALSLVALVAHAAPVTYVLETPGVV
jgi:hypothetical protein